MADPSRGRLLAIVLVLWLTGLALAVNGSGKPTQASKSMSLAAFSHHHRGTGGGSTTTTTVPPTTTTTTQPASDGNCTAPVTTLTAAGDQYDNFPQNTTSSDPWWVQQDEFGGEAVTQDLAVCSPSSWTATYPNGVNDDNAATVTYPDTEYDVGGHAIAHYPSTAYAPRHR